MPTTTINLTGQALASVNDTNVTLTLGGTPATALLKGVSITAGWSGTLADSRIASSATWNAKESALTFGTGLTRSVNSVTIDATVVTLTGVQALSNKTGLISQWTNDSAFITSSSLIPYLTIASAAATYQPIGTYATASNVMAFTNKSGNISQWTNDSGYLTSLSGAVTSVSGTTNRITSTGGATPAIDISATFEALLGKVANPLSQFAATTSAQLAGVISDETGSGALVFATSPTFVTPLLGTPTSGVLTNCTGYTGVNLVITDVTTNDTSTTAHGFFPKLTSNRIYYVSNAGALTALALGASGTVLTSNGATSAPTFNASGSGITVGTTTITSGTSGRIGYNLAGVYQESISYSVTPSYASPYNVHLGFGAATAANGGSYTGTSNVFVGNRAGLWCTSGSNNVLIGADAGATITTGNSNIMILSTNNGANHTGVVNLGATTTGNYQICAGNGAIVSGSQNIVLGYLAGRNSLITGQNNIVIGTAGAEVSTAGINNSFAVGTWTSNTASNQIVFGGLTSPLAGYYTSGFFGSGVTDATPQSFTMNATGGSGSNIAGASMTIAGGRATGTGAAGAIVFKTSVKGSTGSTAQTLGDSFYIAGKYVDLTESTATAFCRINIPTSTVAGGIVTYTIEANDGTDFQSLTGNCRWDVVNKAGTTTIVITDLQNGTGASSSVSTLTNTLTAVDSGSGNVDFKANATSSLTQTVLRINFQVSKNFGTGSVSAS